MRANSGIGYRYPCSDNLHDPSESPSPSDLRTTFDINARSAAQTKRFKLSKELRHLSREWSPLPLSSANVGPLHNENDLDGAGREEEMINHQGEELKDSLRWNLRGIEVPFFCLSFCSIELFGLKYDSMNVTRDLSGYLIALLF